MSEIWWRAAAPMLMSFGIAGCNGTAMPSCDSIEEDVIQLEEKALIKIIKAREVSRSPREVTCQGVAVYRDGTEIRMRYRAYIDEDRDLMIAYDTDEAQQEAIDRVEAEAEAAGRKATKNLNAKWISLCARRSALTAGRLLSATPTVTISDR